MKQEELISKSEVERILHYSWITGYLWLLKEVSKLPTFSPEAIIEEMIEDVLNPEWTTIDEKRLRCLEDVLWKIKWEPPSRHCIT